MLRIPVAILCGLLALPAGLAAAAPAVSDFIEQYCADCHDSATHKGGLDLTALKQDFADTESFAHWVKVHDRVTSGEMPPKKKPQPKAEESAELTKWLDASLLAADAARQSKDGRTLVRRLTRGEYENTLRDLFDMPGLAVQSDLPPDGTAHGFDKNSDALDISHVNLARYVDAAEHALELAVATRPTAPTAQKLRVSLASCGFVADIVLQGDGVLLKDKQPDLALPAPGAMTHIDRSAHSRMRVYTDGASVGIFRHEDGAFSPYFGDYVTVNPGMYRLRTSFWSFQWNKGAVLPGRGTEAARLSVVQLTGNGTGGQHPSYVLGYYDAPSLTSLEHETTIWLNQNELLAFNAASLAPQTIFNRPTRLAGFNGPGVACDWLDIEGPLNPQWPPVAHRLLFGELPIKEWKAAEHPGVRPPLRTKVRQLGKSKFRPDPVVGLWTVQPESPDAEADRLLASFLPKAFRRPVDETKRHRYLTLVQSRMQAGDSFEAAMRFACRTALCSPDFLYLVEPPGKLDDYALATRLAYFLSDSAPDSRLTELAAKGTLHDPTVLRGEVERLLKDAKCQRFIDDFLGQWLRLREIAKNDPDRKLYPEFSPYLQDSMVAETRAYFRELLEKNLDATYLVRSDFAMLNEKLASHYNIPGVVGSQFRRVALPPDSPRGGFLTQASILKVTANGTTTSPVPRGAFVLSKLLGQPPEPPPPGTPAVEPDVRGATTVREQLDKHRSDAICASCHARIDPPGFALESFDVIGGARTRYRIIGEGDHMPHGNIDPLIGFVFRLGRPVDPSGAMASGEKFQDVREFSALLAAHPRTLLRNLAEQLATYAAGRELTYSDRETVTALVAHTEAAGGGIRTLIHELVQSPLFQTR